MKCNPGYRFAAPIYRILPMVLIVVLALSLSFIEAIAESKDPTGSSKTGESSATPAPKTQAGHNLGKIGAKLSNPLADLWALSMSFNMPQFYDGDVNTGDPQLGATLLFQPVMPIPLHGTGDDELRLITRPIIPLIFSEPIPEGFDDFDHKSGIGDIQLPLLLSVPDRIAGHFILGGGPVWLFPSATDDDLGKDQWALGPAVVFGYKTKFMTAGVFPNYFWKIGSSGQDKDTPDVSQGSMLYFLTLNLPDAWQIGMNPTITYNDQASSGNKWNVPVGLYAGKTIKIGKLPVNIKAGLEYSVVSPDDFGQIAQFRLQITPVVPSLIKDPVFGK